ncbi:MAG: orotidine-5'-phosphate decarboxylase [Cyanobacteriota bacterium]|nr:orotidine-5'-phosphate decarboxylase [Cyanobacteriota bacterium]
MADTRNSALAGAGQAAEPDGWADCVIVALDGLGPEQALQLVDGIPGLRWVKVGLELFTMAGPPVVRQLGERGLRLFLDLKFHDIPATMAGACRSAAALGAELITVHACAGREALTQAQQAAEAGAAAAGMDSAPTLLAVTVLTSWEEKRFCQELGIKTAIAERVEQLADLAAAAGVGGCVCSPQEVAALRRRLPQPFVLVTPGIRPPGSDRGDQARVMTPAQAMAAGASRLVIGRPITLAVDPAAAFATCCAALAGG